LEFIRPSDISATPAVQMLGTLVKVVGLAILVSLTATGVMLLHAGHVQDEAAAEASLEQFQGLLDIQGKNLSRNVRDYAHWDEAIEYVILARDREWWNENAGQYAVTALGFSLTLAVSGADDLYFATTADATFTEVSPVELSPSMSALLAAARQRPLFPRNDAAAVGWVDVEGILYLAAATPFVHEQTREMPVTDPGAVLVFAMGIQDKVLPAALEIMGDTEFKRLPIAPTGEVHVPLVLADGTVPEMITWAPPKPGHALILSVLPLAGVAFLFVTALALVFAMRARALARQLYTDELLRRELALRNESILDAAGEGIFGIDHNGLVLFANPAALGILGYRRDELLGQDIQTVIRSRLMDHIDAQCGGHPLGEPITEDRALSSETDYFRRKDGSRFPVEYVITPINESQAITGAVVVFRDITKRRETEEEIIYRANFDSLTKLPNRMLFIERLGQELKLARREKKLVGLLFIDLDRFKDVNDALGHRAGDLLLSQVGHRLQSLLRETDTVGRLGGDEFVILLPHVGHIHEPAEVAERVLRALDDPFDLEGHAAQIGASVGIAVFPRDGEDVSELMHQADLSMYRAKSAGTGVFRAS
jgi:diguanylate cyclase (GGDEF)-like protein/PAS domain S-box-containing protein